MTRYNPPRTIFDIVENGMCTGCGACAFLSHGALEMRINEDGYFTPCVKNEVAPTSLAAALKICPMSGIGSDESAFAERLWPSLASDRQIGRYRRTLATHLTDAEARLASGSGGIVTWLGMELLRRSEVDCVIHVIPGEPGERPLFRYAVSHSLEEVQAGAKSRYYPIELSGVLSELKTCGERAAIIAIPCFIKAIRKLIEQEALEGWQAPYLIGLVCGHLKSSFFGEYLAWQMGITPDDLASCDFRHKLMDRKASTYGFAARALSDPAGSAPHIAPMTQLEGRDWGEGQMRLTACEFCDDVLAECADIAVGDAWLPRYVSDPKGENVVVIRDARIDAIVSEGCARGELVAETLRPADVAQSQSSGLRHRREGLAQTAPEGARIVRSVNHMIGSKTMISAVLMVAAQLLAKSFDFVAVIVLARFLTPADFGLVALASSVMLVANSLTEIPVIEALILNERLEREDIDSAFTLTVLRGLVIALGLLALAQPLAAVFDEARLRPILMVMALAPLVQGFASPNIAYALKALNYGVMAKAQLIGKTASFVAMMVLAWLTHSYWALVAGLVANPALTAIATHFLAPYSPRLTTLRFGDIFAFAGWVTLSRMVFTLNQQMDRFFVGAILGKTKLGFYSMAGDLSSMATFMVATPITQPLFAAFSTMVQEPERLRSAYLRGQQILFTVVAPIGFLFAALAEPFVRIALGEKWLEVVPLIQWLAPAIALQLLIIPTHALAMAMNRPKILVLRETLSLLFRLPPTLLAAWWFGLAAAMAARSVAGTIMVFVMMSISRPLIGATLWRQLSNCSRAFVSILFMGGGAVALDRLVSQPQSIFGQILEMMGLAVAGVAIYCAALFGLWVASGRPAGAESWLLDILRRKFFR